MAKKDEPRAFNEAQAQILLDRCAAQTQYELDTSRTSLGFVYAIRSAHARDSAVRGRAEGLMSGTQNVQVDSQRVVKVDGADLEISCYACSAPHFVFHIYLNLLVRSRFL
jgi:hypothetical protein